MRVVVTGAAGFIGSHIVDRLCNAGIDVVGVDNLDPLVHPVKPGYLNTNVNYQFVDLRNWQLDSSYDDVEAIVHLAAVGGVRRAARDPLALTDNNVLGTARLIKGASRLPNLRRFILMSSFSVYGNAYSYRLGNGQIIPANRSLCDIDTGRFGVYCPHTGNPGVICPINEHAPLQPMEPYGASKAMQEFCLAGFDNLSAGPTKTVIMRGSSVVGSRMRWFDEDATIIARLAGWLSKGQRPVIFEDGLQVRDWIAVNDVVDAVSALLSNPVVPPVLNLCSGVPTTLLEACEQISTTIGVSCEPEIRPQARPGDMRDCLGNATRLIDLLGRQPTPFREAVEGMFKETISSTVPD